MHVRPLMSVDSFSYRDELTEDYFSVLKMDSPYSYIHIWECVNKREFVLCKCISRTNGPESFFVCKNSYIIDDTKIMFQPYYTY
jgi:hypothetical protein